MIGPRSSFPRGVIRFLSNITLLSEEHTKLPSHLIVLNLVRITNAFDFFPFLSQLVGAVFRTETFTKSEVKANLC